VDGTQRAGLEAAREAFRHDGATARLEGLLVTRGADPGADAQIMDALQSSSMCVLSGDDNGEATLLHAVIDGRLLVPAFTRIEALVEAVQRNPAWAAMSVARVTGAELLEMVDADAGIVLNPWTSLEMDFSRG
jgi:hypothetical protein